jgi:tetratricopeptide (TPR) repeat protein
MPLAILLAAGWIELFTPGQIAARIAGSLDFLESDLQDLPERQRSLRAVFASTWDLLTPAERKIYPRLGCFRGGWTAAAAEAVAALSMRDLRRLLDKSLVQRVGQNRFIVHELLRQYAAETLAARPADEAQTRDRHARFYADFLARSTPQMHGAGHLRALAQIGWEQENLRVAWHWAVEQGRIDLLAKSVDGLCLFYHLRGLTAEGIAACQLAIDRLTDLPATAAGQIDTLELTARLLLWQGIFWRERGDECAEALWERAYGIIDGPALTTRDNRRLRADLLYNQGIAAVRLCDYDRAHGLYSAGEALYRALELPRELADLLLEKAIVLWHKTRYDDADVLNLEAMGIFQELDDDGGISESLMGLGLCANGQGRYAAAESYFRRCVKLAEETSGDRMYVAKARNLLGWTLHSTGKFDEALSLCRSSMATSMELDNRYWTSMFQWMAGTAQLHLGDYADADQLLNDTLALAQAINFTRGMAAAQMLLSSAALAMQQWDRALTLAEESVATARTIDRPDELARALAAAAVAHLARGHADSARPYLYEALRLAHTTGANHAMVESLPASVLYLLCLDDPSGAWLYRTLAFEQPLWRASRWFADVVVLQLNAASRELSTKERTSAEEQARQRTLSQAVADLLADLSCRPG